MAKGVKVKVDTTKLDGLIAALTRIPKVRIGILGDGAWRDSEKGEGPSNAMIGLYHEFGTRDGLPQRSFLRVPLIEHLDKRIKEAGVFDGGALEKAIETKNFAPVVLKIGAIAEGIVLDAFQTGGFGKWKPSDMTRKKNRQTLVETHQLRNAITFELTGTGGGES